MAEDRGEAALGRLLRLVADYQAGRLDAQALRAALATDMELGELVRREAGGELTRGGAVIAFGDQSQLGDVHIRDAAGRDIINLTINVQAQPDQQGQAAPVALDAEELAHRRALLAQHRTMLHALELQAAKFGIYAPPHITIEIDELKRKLAALRRELGEG